MAPVVAVLGGPPRPASERHCSLRPTITIAQTAELPDSKPKAASALAVPPPVTSTLSLMLVATSLAAIVIIVAVAAITVISVLGLFVWGTIQDGREEKALKEQRKRRKPQA